MKNKISLLLITLILLSSLLVISTTTKVLAHKSKNHKPIICIPESERTKAELSHDKTVNYFHRLSKKQQDCATLLLEKFGDEIRSLEEKLSGLAECGDIPFNHEASESAKVYKKPDAKSKVIAKVKKGDELLFFAPSEKNKNWYYVKVRKDKNCAEGYIDQQFVVKNKLFHFGIFFGFFKFI